MTLPDGTYGGQSLAGEQLRIVEAIWRAGKDASLTDRDAVIALITADTESNFQTGPAVYMKDHNSVGPFQQRPLPTNPWWGTVAQCEDPYTSARLFLRELAKIADRGSMTEGQAAQAVQRSAYPDRYQQRVDVGRALVQALNSGGKPVSTWVLPGATYRPVVNCSAGNRGPTLGVIVHVTTDDAGSPFGWFNNPSAAASSTWFVGNGKGGTTDGGIEQFVDPDTEHAWAQGAGNRDYHSIEFEGTVDEPMTDKQLRAGGHILAEGHKRYGWTLTLANLPGQPGLGVHYMGGAAWGGHPCPGPARAEQRPQIIAYAQAEIAPPAPQPAPPAPPQEMFTMSQYDDLTNLIKGYGARIENIERIVGAITGQELGYGRRIEHTEQMVTDLAAKLNSPKP